MVVPVVFVCVSLDSWTHLRCMTPTLLGHFIVFFGFFNFIAYACASASYRMAGLHLLQDSWFLMLA